MTKEATEPKKRTRAKKPPAEKRKDIPFNMLCRMCNNGMFTEKLGDYEFMHKGEKHVVTNVPCVECDSCGGRKFNSDDVMRPVSYMKSNGHSEVDYAEIMEIYWSWQNSMKTK